MTDVIQKIEALAAMIGKDVDAVWDEFIAFIDHKKATAAPESTAAVVEPSAEPAPTEPAATEPAATEPATPAA